MLENKLAEFTLEHTFKKISNYHLHIIKRNILDSYAGICASLSDHEMLRKFDRLTNMVPDQKGGMDVWGTGKKALMANALFMNCILGRRSDLLNTYMSPNNMGGSHPSDNVALTLTLAAFWGKSGKEMLSATYLAYQLSCAFADYYNPQASNFDHDAQALMYIPLIIGYLLELNSKELIESQRIAGMLGLTTDQSSLGEVSDWRHCTYASAALRALEAVRLSQAGFKGATDIFYGDAGINHFFQHTQSILEPLPDLESVIFKRWPALVFCQTPIDAAIEAGTQIRDGDTIHNVEVYTYKKAIEIGAIPTASEPKSRAGRTHSIPYCVAVAIIKKTVKYEYFDDVFLENEAKIASLFPRISVVEDPDMTTTFPDGAPCRVIVHLKGGATIKVEKKYPKGDPHDPLSDPELEEKASDYLKGVAKKEEVKKIIDRIWEIENEDSVNWLIEPLIKRIV